MRKHSPWRALALATLLSTPFIQAALADEPEQQAMTRMAAEMSFMGLTGPYDTLAPTVGN
ncbi:MAG TPA: hypothetical protein VEU53_04120 [Stellaceae bacterium]|nr:hypothetical protein [Stellaceae bacterium]